MEMHKRIHVELALALRISRDGSINLQPWFPNIYAHVAGATLFARRSLFFTTGMFEAVRFDGDFEFSRRLDELVSPKSRVVRRLPLYFASSSIDSLTTSGVGRLDSLRRNDIRLDYHKRLYRRYNEVTDLSDLILDGVSFPSHADYSSPISVTQEALRRANAKGVGILFLDRNLGGSVID
jgi:hypothetical protein